MATAGPRVCGDRNGSDSLDQISQAVGLGGERMIPEYLAACTVKQKAWDTRHSKHILVGRELARVV